MSDIVRDLRKPTGDMAIEVLAHFLAAQVGMIRADDDTSAFARLPPEARHGFRELAEMYVTIVRNSDNPSWGLGA